MNYPCEGCKHNDRAPEGGRQAWPCGECRRSNKGASDMYDNEESEERECETCEHELLEADSPPCNECSADGSAWRQKVSLPVLQDEVNSPAHYNQYPIEVIQLARHLTFNRGNVVKYVARAGHKDKSAEVEDLKKARWYIDDEIQRLTGEGEHAKP